MNIWGFVLLILVLLCVAIYATRQVEQVAPFRGLIIAVECIIAIILILSRAGVHI